MAAVDVPQRFWRLLEAVSDELTVSAALDAADELHGALGQWIDTTRQQQADRLRREADRRRESADIYAQLADELGERPVKRVKLEPRPGDSSTRRT